ncbi:MAG: hypothetical protein F6K39_11420 [Okeania sp. SIO3B3]|nr:hypothetical protein [Okeania sp. SIO3B3]
MNFNLDENVSNAIENGLRIRGIDVTTSAEASLIGASDRQQLAYALSEKRVIFTFDNDFLSLAATGMEHSGIIYTRQQRQSIGKVISCPVEYLHFGGRKAGGRRQEAEGKKRRLREKVFSSLIIRT